MKIELGPFARAGLEGRLGPDLAAGVREALRRYTERPGTPEPVSPPAFLPDSPPDSDRGAALVLAVDPALKAALSREADAHGVSMRGIVRHAVMVYLAEADAEDALSAGLARG